MSGNSEIHEDIQSPIITSRRGLTLQNWADMTTGSGYSVRSDGNATVSGPRRKTRRGKRKRRNLSASNTNVSLTESFKEALFTEGALEISRGSCASMNSGVEGPGARARTDRRATEACSTNTISSRAVVLQGSQTVAKRKDGFSTLQLASTPRRSGACPVLSRVSELVRTGNPYGDQDGVLDLDDSRVEEVDMGYTVQRRKADHEPRLDTTQEIDLNNLLPANCKRLTGGQKIRSKGVIQFVILRRTDGSDEEYEVFPRKALENLINSVEGKNAASANGLSAAFKFANMWGEIPLLGLYSADLSLLAGYRFQIELYSDGYEYQTFPREALDRRLALTMMLWQNLEAIKTPDITPNLMDRNPGLAGGVKVARMKVFRASDMDARGESMLGARLAQLDGNESFLRSLERFPRSHRFGLGVGTVIIRGGVRAPEPEGSNWGQNRGKQRPNTYSDAAAMGTRTDDLNISSASLNLYASKASGVMSEAERSIRGRGFSGPGGKGDRKK